MRTSTLILAALGALAISAPTFAAPGKGEAKRNAAAESRDSRDRITLSDREARIYRDYYGRAENCPPGLAKKNNGCLPPGIAKKRYEIGRPLGRDVVVEELPYALIRDLPGLPNGLDYRLVDGDLGVIDLATLVLLDAIGVN